MILHRSADRCMLGIFLLSSLVVIQAQVTTWNIRNNNQEPLTRGYYLAGGASSVPVLQPYIGSQRDQDVRAVYGPQLSQECRIK
ncbi:hypothetical protein NPIL_636981 [Nephila pilipes]|uniref:Uncharacterized protein n=1 Tax=Nephila pilipes TaxID=299642 RepID=A0A8X6TV60_NEPPI|nr:hypothetical protein NPIL_636981 [Nephila pilipes]